MENRRNISYTNGYFAIQLISDRKLWMDLWPLGVRSEFKLLI